MSSIRSTIMSRALHLRFSMRVADPASSLIRKSTPLTVLFSLFAFLTHAQTVDLVLERGFRSDVTIPISDLDKLSLEYARMPYYLANDLNFAARVRNLGPDSATNVQVNVQVDLNGTGQGSFSSVVLPFLAPGAVDTLVIDADWSSSGGTGEASLAFSVSSNEVDPDIMNNHDTVTIDVNSYVRYSRTGGGWIGTAGNCYQGCIIGTRYEVLSEFSICAISCVVPNTPGMLGAILIGNLLDEDFNLLAISSDYEVVASQLSNPGEEITIWIYIGSVQLEAGHDYYAAVEMYATDSVRIGTREVGPDSTSILYDSNLGTWTYIPEIPMIGIGEGCGWINELPEHGLALSQNSPNPCNTTTRIPFSMTQASEITFELLNAQGQVVKSYERGRYGPGEHQLQLDIQDLPSGIYSYSVRADLVSQSRRMVVLR